jgi:hypothetical protein
MTADAAFGPEFKVRLTALALVLVSAPAFGQAHSWLYVTSQSSGLLRPAGPVVLREVALLPGGPGPITREVRLAGSLGSDPVVTFDGRFVAWALTPEGSTQPALALFDRTTGGTTILSGMGGDILADPTALRLFVFRASGSSFINQITILEPGLVRQVDIPPIVMLGPMSSDGRNVFAVRQVIDPGGTTWRYHIAVLDPLTGAERRQLPPFDAFKRPVGLALSQDGQRLFVTIEAVPNVLVLDAVTGAQLASATVALTPTLEFIGNVTFDDQHDRVFVTRISLSGSVGFYSDALVLDARSLATLGSSRSGTRIVDRVQRIMLGVGGWSDRFSGCGSAAVETWADPPAPVSSLEVVLDGGCLRLGLATAPEAPATLTTSVSGRRVTLDWTPIPGAIDYQIEAGSAPGLANLAVVRAGGSRPFVVEGTPSGTYYVRVRALNYVGAGAASIERVVVVP